VLFQPRDEFAFDVVNGQSFGHGRVLYANGGRLLSGNLRERGRRARLIGFCFLPRAAIPMLAAIS